MKLFSRILFIILLPAFWGCAVNPQLNVNASDEFWQNKEQKIGVYVSAIPEVRGHIQGAGCLLCLAVAAGINSSLATHMKTQSADDLKGIKSELIAKLKAKGLQVTSIDQFINFKKLKRKTSKELNTAKKDFSALGSKYSVDHILVVDIKMIGTMRNFSNYVPIGDPSAIVRGNMYIVNTKTNVYEFYEDINISKLAEGKWKEPPNYPGITNAYYTALVLAKDNIMDLKSSAPLVYAQ